LNNLQQFQQLRYVGGEKSKVQRAHLGNVDGYVEPERVLGKRLYSDITTADTDTGTVTSSSTAATAVPATEQKPVGKLSINGYKSVM
jgi:hypothetical protein